MPAGLPQSFELTYVADSIVNVDKKMIFIRTKMQYLRSNFECWKSQPKNTRDRISHDARCAVKTFLPRSDDVYNKVSGDREAQTVWQTFCTEITVLAMTKLLDGGDIRVTINDPEVIRHERGTSVKVVYFTVAQDLLL